MTNLYDLPDSITVRAEGPLRLITLNRPERLNASSTEMLFAYPRLTQALAQDPDARVALLTGAGQAFSVGHDEDHFVRTLEDARFTASVQENARRTVLGFIDLPIPVIAAVNGPAVGWGATMVTLCDVVLMADTAYLAEPHVNLGLVVGDGISVSWPLYTSLLRAKELIFTGERITAEKAVDYGLANRVVPGDLLMEDARALASRLLAQPRDALRETKKIMNRYLHASASQHLDATIARQYAASQGEEHQRVAHDFLARQSGRRPGGT